MRVAKTKVRLPRDDILDASGLDRRVVLAPLVIDGVYRTIVESAITAPLVVKSPS